MIRSTLSRYCYLAHLHILPCGDLGVATQPSGVVLLWQVLGRLVSGMIWSDRGFEIYSSAEKFNLDRMRSGWRFCRAPM